MEKLKNVLLIDDDDIANLLNLRLIERAGIAENIRVIRNGLEGLNYFGLLCQLDACPEMIILDMKMPLMDGLQFLSAFHDLSYSNKYNTKIIMLSSSENPYEIKRAKELGCDEFAAKPLTPEKLTQLMERHFNLVE